MGDEGIANPVNPRGRRVGPSGQLPVQLSHGERGVMGSNGVGVDLSLGEQGGVACGGGEVAMEMPPDFPIDRFGLGGVGAGSALGHLLPVVGKGLGAIGGASDGIPVWVYERGVPRGGSVEVAVGAPTDPPHLFPDVGGVGVFVQFFGAEPPPAGPLIGEKDVFQLPVQGIAAGSEGVELKSGGLGPLEEFAVSTFRFPFVFMNFLGVVAPTTGLPVLGGAFGLLGLLVLKDVEVDGRIREEVIEKGGPGVEGDGVRDVWGNGLDPGGLVGGPVLLVEGPELGGL
jgi:hypothetical protein